MRPWSRREIEAVEANQVGVYGLRDGASWIHVGTGSIRKRLLAHFHGDNPCIIKHQPTYWNAEVCENADSREPELIYELQPLCNGPVDQGQAVIQVSDHDCVAARQLPDEFLQLSGSPIDRIVESINRHWAPYPPQARAELAQALLPIFLGMLEQGKDPSDRHRELCESVVMVWLKRQPPSDHG